MNSKILGIFIVLLFIEYTYGTHFRGGTITARPISSNPTSVLMEFTLSFAWRLDFNPNHFCNQTTIDRNGLIGDNQTFICRKTNGTACSNIISQTTVFCKFFSPTSNGDNWSYGKRVFNHSIARVRDFEASFSGSNWLQLAVGGTPAWEVRLKLDTTNRADKGVNVINTTPISTIPPIVKVRRGVLSTIPITWADADSTDVIRCRWAVKSMGECGDACMLVPPATLNGTTCILTFDGTQSTTMVGYYAATIQLEDFRTVSDKVPMSSVPVQFLIQVVESKSNCTRPPVFIDSRPPSSCNALPLGERYFERLTAQSQCPGENITSIAVIGLVGSRVSELTNVVGNVASQRYVNLTWVPTREQQGPNVICAVATDSSLLSTFNCYTIIAGEAQAPKPLKVGPFGSVSVSNEPISWTIFFDQPVERPQTQAFINFFDSSNKLIHRIDTSSSSDVTFINNSMVFKTSYRFNGTGNYVEFDYGIVRGTSFCKISSEPVQRNSTFWSFEAIPATTSTITTPTTTTTTTTSTTSTTTTTPTTTTIETTMTTTTTTPIETTMTTTSTTTSSTTTTTLSTTTSLTTIPATTTMELLGCKKGLEFSCQNNAICAQNGSCICPPGYSGQFCESYLGCLMNGSASCLNDGNCAANGTCICRIGFVGLTCSEYIGCNAGECLTCMNGGFCLKNGTCKCKIGFVGETCSNYIGCKAGGSLTCVNRGQCTKDGQCVCQLGFSGLTCANGCKDGGMHKCLNGGVCGSNNTCICSFGYSGATCSIYDGCMSGGCLACENGGTCGPDGNCSCPLGYSGKTCSTYDDIGCLAGGPHACQNNGTCDSNGNCICPQSFTGLTCAIAQQRIFIPNKIDSDILTAKEIDLLVGTIMDGNRRSMSLLYRGTRDGFNAKSFHEKCDGFSDTITIINSNTDSVFGGYVSVEWDNVTGNKVDKNAFLFSVRRNGISVSEKFKVKESYLRLSNGTRDLDYYAIYCDASHGPTFGYYYYYNAAKFNLNFDIYIDDRANERKTSYTHFCNAFECPMNRQLSSDSLNHLAGSYNFVVNQIEVFHLV